MSKESIRAYEAASADFLETRSLHTSVLAQQYILPAMSAWGSYELHHTNYDALSILTGLAGVAIYGSFGYIRKAKLKPEMETELDKLHAIRKRIESEA